MDKQNDEEATRKQHIVAVNGGHNPDGTDYLKEMDDPLERRNWFFSSRVDAEGKIPNGLLLRASAQRHKLEQRQSGEEPPPSPPGGPGSVNWTPIGPSVVAHGQASGHPRVSGRFNAIAVGPAGSRVYAGAANGGIWFSPDGGASWQPLDDYSPSPGFVSGVEADSLSVGALAVRFGATAATDRIFVGTGEPGGALDAYFGIGIRSSPGGGAPGTWSLEATNLASAAIFRIVIDPDDPTHVVAATSRGLFRRPAAAPFAAWTQVTSPAFTNPTGQVSDLVIAGSGAGKRYYAAFETGGVYRSPDGSTWTALTGVAGGRTALAAGESDSTVIYALGQNGSLYRLVGAAFQTVSGVPAALFFGNQGWYDIILAVDPSNADTVYLGGDLVWDGDWTLSLYKGTITGAPGSYVFPFNPANDIFINASGQRDSSLVPNDPTWIGRGIHADGHALTFGLNAAGTAHDASNVWVGTDGGLFQSPASGALGTFTAHNTGLAITELTYIGQNPATDAVLFAGSQDNGTLRCWGEQAWFESPEGDGGGVAVDPNNPYRVMREYVRATLSRSTDGGASGAWGGLTFPPITASTTAQKTAASTENSQTRFYAPIAASPASVAPTLAAFGTRRLWLTADWGTTWVTLPTGTNPYTPAIPDLVQDQLDGTPVTALAFVANGAAARIFAATGNHVWRFDQGAPWTRIQIPDAGLPAGHFITALAVDDPAAGSFYATLGGSGLDHVWYYDGTAWLSAGLSQATLDVPTHAVVVDPDQPQIVYIGTDVGCWQGTKSGVTWTWTLFSQGLPEAAITDLAIHRRTRLLRAATHGRGAWEIALAEGVGSATDPDLYLRVNYADTGRLPGGARFPWVEGAPDPTASGFNVYHWMSADIKVRRGSLSGLPALSSPPDYLDYATNMGDYIDSTTHIETADESGTDRIFVQVHNRGLTAVPGAQVRVLLLLTDAAAGLPALPTAYATHINMGDTSLGWLGPQWRFADPATPYRTLPGLLDVRTPQIVEYDVDLATLALPAGHDHVCAAAFISTTNALDQLTANISSLDTLTMQDKHVAHRNLHLVPAGARPLPPAQDGRYQHSPQTMLIDFHNATDKEAIIDMVFQRAHFPGHFSLMLPKLDLVGGSAQAITGWQVVEHSALETTISSHLGHWLERASELVEHLGEAVEQIAEQVAGEIVLADDREVKVRKLAGLDRRRTYVADNSPRPAIRGVRIPPAGVITAAITVQAPAAARPGDRFRFEVIQYRAGTIVGGSSYIIVVTDASRAL